MLASMRAAIERYRMVSTGDRVLCALSGGMDSVCMTHALCALRGELGISVCAAHFSHGIRPDRAEEEWALARDLCRRLGVEVVRGEGDVPAFARQEGLSLEDAARRLRYGFLHSAMTELGAQKAATAHHRGDSCETILLNLIRGTGTVGMGGIPPVRGVFIRPLIDTDRGDIAAYAAQNGLTWCEDESNADQGLPRNRLRHTVLPALREINPAAPAVMARMAYMARQDGDFLLQCARELAGQARQTGEEVSIPAHALQSAHPAVSGRAARLLYVRAGGREGDFTLRHAEAVLALCRSASPSARADLPRGLCARRQYGMLVFSPSGDRPPLPMQRLTPGQVVRWGEWRLCLDPPQGGEGWPMKVRIPLDAVQKGLCVRPRAQGDVITLTGGSRSLKKLMIDRKIPKKDRDRMPVLCDNKKIRAVFLDRPMAAADRAEKTICVAAGREQG